MKIPALDPFEVQKAGYNSDNLNIEFFDMKSYNLTNIETLTTHVDMQERSISLNFSNTNLRTFAKYKTTGKLATIAIEGGGPMDLNCCKLNNQLNNSLSNLSFISARSDTYLKFTWDVIQKNGKDYALVTSFQYNVDIGDFQNSLGNLVPGNAELTQAINNAINENGKDTIVAIIRNIFYEIFHNTIKHVLESYPIDILFPKK